MIQNFGHCTAHYMAYCTLYGVLHTIWRTVHYMAYCTLYSTLYTAHCTLKDTWRLDPTKNNSTPVFLCKQKLLSCHRIVQCVV